MPPKKKEPVKIIEKSTEVEEEDDDLESEFDEHSENEEDEDLNEDDFQDSISHRTIYDFFDG